MNLRLFPNLQSNLLMTAPSTCESETQTHVSSSRSLAWIQIQVSFFLFFFTKMMYGYIHMSNLTSDIQRTIDETVMLWPMAILIHCNSLVKCIYLILPSSVDQQRSRKHWHPSIEGVPRAPFLSIINIHTSMGLVSRVVQLWNWYGQFKSWISWAVQKLDFKVG